MFKKKYSDLTTYERLLYGVIFLIISYLCYIGLDYIKSHISKKTELNIKDEFSKNDTLKTPFTLNNIEDSSIKDSLFLKLDSNKIEIVNKVEIDNKVNVTSKCASIFLHDIDSFYRKRCYNKIIFNIDEFLECDEYGNIILVYPYIIYAFYSQGDTVSAIEYSLKLIQNYKSVSNNKSSLLYKEPYKLELKYRINEVTDKIKNLTIKDNLKDIKSNI